MTLRILERAISTPRPAMLAIGGFAGFAAAVVLSRWLLAAFGFTEIASHLPWYLSRAAGITAYLLLSATMVLGLAIATRLGGRRLSRPVVFSLHEHLAWMGLAATGLHLGALLADSYLPFRVVDLLVPFAAPYRPAAVALGVIALYASVLITSSFAVRSRIGHRAWRTIHIASFGTYVLATAHGILAGSSTSQPWMQWLYLASGATVLLLTNYRILLTKQTPGTRPAPATRSPGRVLEQI
jgi:predicted ferric reductase